MMHDDNDTGTGYEHMRRWGLGYAFLHSFARTLVDLRMSTIALPGGVI